MEVTYETKDFDPSKFLNGVARGLNQAAIKVAGDAKPLTPHLEGDLERSQTVHEATATDLLSAVSYDTDYAIRRHEEADVNFTTDPNPAAQAKFLEQPFDEDLKDSVDLIKARAREGLE